MARIFKFRAWDIRYKHYVSLVESSMFNNPEYIVEQHTYHADVMGNGIYEGDILKYSLYITTEYGPEWGTGEIKQESKWVAQKPTYIQYDPILAAYTLYNTSESIKLGALWDHFEVIGNKNQHPELL